MKTSVHLFEYDAWCLETRRVFQLLVCLSYCPAGECILASFGLLWNSKFTSRPVSVRTQWALQAECSLRKKKNGERWPSSATKSSLRSLFPLVLLAST